MRKVGHAARIGERTGAYRILVENLKQDLGIDEGLQEVARRLGWIDLAQDTYRLCALLNVVMNLDSKNAGNSLN